VKSEGVKAAAHLDCLKEITLKKGARTGRNCHYNVGKIVAEGLLAVFLVALIRPESLAL